MPAIFGGVERIRACCVGQLDCVRRVCLFLLNLLEHELYFLFLPSIHAVVLVKHSSELKGNHVWRKNQSFLVQFHFNASQTFKSF